MDFNYLYHRQQVSLMRAHAAAGLQARAVHRELATRYSECISRGRAERGAGPATRTSRAGTR